MKKRTARDYAKALLAVADRIADKHVGNFAGSFLELLARDRMLSQAKAILQEYDRLAQKRDGRMPIHVTTRGKLEPKLRKAIAERFGMDREVVESVNATLLGGCLVKDGDTTYDLTLDTQMKKFSYHLIHE